MTVIQGLNGIDGTDYTIISNANGYLYTFYSNQSITFDKSYIVQYVIVNGGSGGVDGELPLTILDNSIGGSGGYGGAVSYGIRNVNSASVYPIIVGSGGLNSRSVIVNGGVSSFDGIEPLTGNALGGLGTNSLYTTVSQSSLFGQIGTEVTLNNVVYKFGGGGSGGTSGNTPIVTVPTPSSIDYGGAPIRYGQQNMDDSSPIPNTGGGGSGGGSYDDTHITQGSDGAAGVVMIYVATNAIDLGSLFAPLQTGLPVIVTGYEDINGVDLGSLFAPLQTGSTGFITGYEDINGVDLGSLFAPYRSGPVQITRYEISE